MNESAHMQADVSDREVDLLSLALVLAEHARLLVFGSVAAGLIALGVTFLIPPTYTATTRILPPQQQQGAAAMLAQQLGSLAGLAGSAAGIKNPADVYVAMLQSATVADRIVNRFDLMQVHKAEFREDARKELGDSTRLKAGKDGVITIEVDDRNPARAAEIANAYVQELQALTKTLAMSEAGQRRMFFESQLKEAKDSLTSAEIALRASGVSESILKADPQAAVEGIARIRAEITAAEVRLASMRSYLTNNSVEIRQAQQQLAALRAQLAKFELSDTGTQEDSGAEYIAKYRDYKYYETLFELMAKQYELAKLDEAREGTLIQVLDPAQTPERRSKPNRKMIAAVAAVAFLLLCAICLFLRETVRKAAESESAAEKLRRISRALRGVRVPR